MHPDFFSFQVYPDGIRHIRADKRVNEWKAPGKKTIIKCAVNQRQVVIALTGGELVYFEMDPVSFLNFSSSIASCSLRVGSYARRCKRRGDQSRHIIPCSTCRLCWLNFQSCWHYQFKTIHLSCVLDLLFELKVSLSAQALIQGCRFVRWQWLHSWKKLELIREIVDQNNGYSKSKIAL